MHPFFYEKFLSSVKNTPDAGIQIIQLIVNSLNNFFQ